MKQKWLPWAIAVLVLLLIIFSVSLFSPKPNTNGDKNLSFPQSTGSNAGAASGQSSAQVGNGGLAVIDNAPTSAASYTPTQGTQVPSQNMYAPRYATVYQSYSFPGQSTSRPVTSVTPNSNTQQPVVSPPSNASGTGLRVIGHTQDGKDILFNPQTGDLFVGDTQINAAGAHAGNSGGSGSPLSSALGDIASNALGSALGSATGAGVGVFGGLLSIVSPCDVGTLYLVKGIPYSGPLMWVPGISSAPPYLNAMGTPPLVGYAIGHYAGTSVCFWGDAPVGGGPIMYGYGTGL